MLGKIEELKLISRCILLDDRNAFGMLVEEYQAGIRRFFLNLTLGDVMLSEDLAQETFIKAYLNIRSFKGVARFKTWLYRIGYNEFYTYMSRQREVTLDESLPIEDNNDRNMAFEASEDVKMCMKALSGTERTIITLFYLEDQPIKKICEITNIPEGTVKSHLSRAKTKMAKIMNR